MRVKRGTLITEEQCIEVRTSDIIVGTDFYDTGKDTAMLGEQLLKKGYVDLTPYRKSDEE